MEGIKTRITSQGIPVMSVHYSADPEKRPGTEHGDKWLARASSAYPGGTKNPRWRKEMEIEYGAMGGLKLFPEWDNWIMEGKIVIDPYDPVGYRLYASYDHGWRNPSCYLVHGVDSDGNLVTLWEFYADHVGVPHIAEIINGNDVVLPDGRRFTGNPYAGKERLKIADPSLWAEDQPMSDGTNKSIARLYRKYGVNFIQGERGGDTMVAEWLHGHFWKDPSEPRYRIQCPQGLHPGTKPPGGRSGIGAPWLIWELGQQRHKEHSTKVGLTRDQPEELVDKNNHAFDAMKYWLRRFPPKPTQKKAPGVPNTFSWWREVGKKRDTGMKPGTFRI